jgi:hypothetical protein
VNVVDSVQSALHVISVAKRFTGKRGEIEDQKSFIRAKSVRIDGVRDPDLSGRRRSRWDE